MKHYLRNKRGVAMEMAIGTMLIINAMCMVLLVVAEMTGVLNKRTVETATMRVSAESIGEDFFRAHEKVRKAGFLINTDLICGLPGEDLSVFKHSLNSCISLQPENITVHTLSLKRGSVFTTEGAQKNEFGAVGEMIDCAHESLHGNGYVPYYMYRQKNMADNLENTGYCKPGTQCVYNIDMMEESATVIGIGAGAMSKIVSGDRIERLSSPKGFREYIERVDGTISAKKNFFLS